jgi:UDP-N-acetylmuramoyl-tripeptide--D-alanyl-D-alanine ligase
MGRQTMADALWTKDELLAAIEGEVVGTLPRAITGISIDTRTIAPGELFFAIKGERTDGHDYVEQAFAAGAGLAIVGRDFRGDAAGPFIRVEDTLEALNALGRAGRDRSTARIIAVTGSVGKTGTKEMLRLMLGRLGATHASDKSYNNHWGVPLSLARLPRAAAYAVFEIGMNHSGEITPLTGMVRPHAAIITTVAPVHMAYFRDVEEIAEAKAEIFKGLEPGGTAILNRDNPYYLLLAERARQNGAGRIVGFSQSADSGAESRLLSLEASAAGSRIEADILGETVRYHLGAPGGHLAANSLAALTGVKALGGDVAQAAAALGEFDAPQGRGAQSLHRISDGSICLIDESYNANPASMAAAFGVLAAVGQGRRIAALGDMLELGGTSVDLHRGLAEPIAAARIDLVFSCGPDMRALHEALPEDRRGVWAPDSASLKAALFEALKAGDTIMIKGSLGSRMGLIVEALKQTFPPLASEGKAAAG